MSLRVPPAIKAADLARFAMRASQSEKAKPVISYYCDYWIVDQILAKGLHTVDEECQVYTTRLVEKLEQFKTENGDLDVIVDEVAAKAYIEQFGLETLQRADNAVGANKASRQTADTYLAGATFLELIQIWGEIDPESASKIKYAKYHALRIAKALKAGQDPNASNPAPEKSPSVEEGPLPALDPNDAEVQMLNGVSTTPRQPSITDVPDEAHRTRSNLARQSIVDESLHPSRAPSATRLAKDQVSPVDATAPAEDFYNQPSNYDVSPLAPDPSTSERRPSVGGNYFPQVVPSRQQHSSLNLPSAPSDLSSPPPEPSLHPHQPAVTDVSNPPVSQTHPQGADHTMSTHGFQPPAAVPGPIPPPAQQSHHNQPLHQQPPPFYPSPIAPAPQATPTTTAQRTANNPPPPPSLAHPLPHPATTNTTSQHPNGAIGTTNPNLNTNANVNVNVDEASIAASQKHARWAISALNFEDVPTAIRELRGALEALGAR